MVKQDHLHADPEPSKAIACPFSKCIGKPIRLGLLSSGGSWWVWCKTGGSAGPTAGGELEAVQLWNERHQDPPRMSLKDKAIKGLMIVIAWLIQNG